MDLLERNFQFEELSRSLRDARAGAGKIALVSGEAGAGKSALVEEFTRRAAGGTRLLWGHCDALQTSRVLGPVNEVVAGLSSLADTPRAQTVSREMLFAGLMERLSAPNPLAIVILEDLHWADEATLDFVRFIGRRIQRTRCLLIATYRDDVLAPAHLLRGVLGEITGAHAVRIPLPSLSLSAVEQLARGTQHNGRKVYSVAGGNPFFVRELLSVPTDTIPETVRDAVLARLLQCSAAARGVAELVSLLPGRCELALIRAILGDIGAAADDAVMSGLLRYHDQALMFRHELGRLAVESTVSRTRAYELHQIILGALIEQGADISQIVHHAAHAQDVKALLEYAPRAARQAALAGAHLEAVSHLATALRFADSYEAPERAGLFEMHAAECNVTNLVTAAIDSATKALLLWAEQGDVSSQARVQLQLGRQYWKTGRKTLADQHVAEAIALLETLPRERGLAMAYSARSHLAMSCGSTDEALDFGRRALDLAIQFEDHGVRAHALNNIGSAISELGDRAGLEKLVESLAVALQHNLHDHAGRAYASIVSTSVRQRLTSVTQRYMGEGIEYCDVHDVQDSLSYIRVHGAYLELNCGQWDKAARTAAELIEHHTLCIAQRVPALVVLARVRARRGDPGADVLLDEAARLAAPTGELQRIGLVAAARAELAWYRGDLQCVAQEVAIGLKVAANSRDPWIPAELAYWGHRADPAPTSGGPVAGPFSLMIEGDWQGAASAWQQLGAPYEQALALAEGPEAALRESLVILEQMGAGPLAAIVRQRLRELGVRGVPRGPRASTRGNPAGLTKREIQVLTLLVRGDTNGELARRLHISAKTVDHHVSSILEKLDVRSRTEAVAAAFGLGILKAGNEGSAAVLAR